jgi:hypothetical protein
MPAYNFEGYRPANSRYINQTFNGIKVEAVLAKSGVPATSSTQYIAICRKVDAHSTARVVDYNHVVLAARGDVDLETKYDRAPTISKSGLTPVGHSPQVDSTPTKVADQPVRHANGRGQALHDLEFMDFASAMAILNGLAVAAKKNPAIRDLIKLVATTL